MIMEQYREKLLHIIIDLIENNEPYLGCDYSHSNAQLKIKEGTK